MHVESALSRMPRSRCLWWRPPLVALLLGLLLSGCGLEGLAFRSDTRVEITTPADRETVTLPLVVAWSTTGLPAETRFAVFIDRAPQPPGEPIDWIARDDDACQARPACPDHEYLADRYIHIADGASIVIQRVPPRATDRQYRDFHEVTVVLLDEHGRRQGESGWSVQFRVANSL